MAIAEQLRLGTAAEHATFVGLEGELTAVTDTHRLRLHDGVTPGGHEIGGPTSGGSGGGSTDAKEIFYFPTPQIAVPVAQRLGAEVHLTDGYVEGSNLTDFSDLLEANLARAASLRRPFVIPGGKFAVSRKVSHSGVPISVFGFGRTMSVLEWQAGSQSSGLEFAFDNDDDTAHFEDFGLYTKLFNQGTALRLDYSGKILPNNGNPVIFSRFQPTGTIRGVLVRGTDGTLSNGFQRGFDIEAPLGFRVQDCDLWGASTGADPNYASDIAIRLGTTASGYGHPCELYVQNCRTFRWNTACQFEGVEGAFAEFNNFVGVGVGIHFKDNDGRPHLNAVGNHINCANVGILLENCSEFNVSQNLIYLVIGANRVGTGVVVKGQWSTFGGIIDNMFSNSDTLNANSHLNSIIIEGGRDITIDSNRYRKNCPATISGVWLTGGAKKVTVGPNERYEKADGPFGAVNYEILDNGSENMVPGYGARYTQVFQQNLVGGGPTTLAWQTASDIRGNAPTNLPTGDYVVPASGVYEFAAGCAFTANGQQSGCFINITRNGTTGDSAIASGGSFGGPDDTPAVHCSTGPITLNKGDVIRVVVNPGAGRGTRLVPGTFFNVRRLA